MKILTWFAKCGWEGSWRWWQGHGPAGYDSTDGQVIINGRDHLVSRQGGLVAGQGSLNKTHKHLI